MALAGTRESASSWATAGNASAAAAVRTVRLRRIRVMITSLRISYALYNAKFLPARRTSGSVCCARPLRTARYPPGHRTNHEDVRQQQKVGVVQPRREELGLPRIERQACQQQ